MLLGLVRILRQKDDIYYILGLGIQGEHHRFQQQSAHSDLGTALRAHGAVQEPEGRHHASCQQRGDTAQMKTQQAFKRPLLMPITK